MFIYVLALPCMIKHNKQPYNILVIYLRFLFFIFFYGRGLGFDSKANKELVRIRESIDDFVKKKGYLKPRYTAPVS